ncbi:MAG: enoyl-CoA hydratase/isomerase family protein [Candidatus Protistobacter heckmanni]|nr:enoyl-CoA hydratase/isomerase family protein [Candidatus Protistobacter heckmanni]
MLNIQNKDFRLEIADGVAEIIFGPAAAMPVTSDVGHAELAGIWRRLDAMPEVRTILVRSESKAFCSGGKMELVEEMINGEAARLRVYKEARELVEGMIDCDKPIVSVIHGAAVVAGLAVALLAEISIVTRGAKLIDSHTKLGVAAGDHAAIIWPLLCGVAKAKYYLMLCETLTGEEAERIGLVTMAVEDGELLEKARDIVARLAAGSPLALSATKRTINHSLRALIPAFEHSLAMEMMGFAGADSREGLAAFKEKRSPSFRG